MAAWSPGTPPGCRCKNNNEIERRPMTHNALITSNWLRQYILERGGALNVTTRTVIAG